MDRALADVLEQVQDDEFANAIFLFTDGFSPVDPRQIEALNSFRAGSFPIGIGDRLERNRLEMMAALNYGFVTYINSDNLRLEVLQIFTTLNHPVLANTAIEFDKTDLSRLLPRKIPTAYAGSFFSIVGRYGSLGRSDFSISGLSSDGITTFDGTVEFADRRNANRFVEQLWGKESIDDLERQIAVFGFDEALKDEVVSLSLAYNLRSRFTALKADYETLYEPEENEGQSEISLGDFFVGSEIDLTATAVAASSASIPLPDSPSFLTANYPNPFNATTLIRLFIDATAVGQTKLLKVYNGLGQQIAFVDISHLEAGWHTVPFNGTDLFGQALASGVYFVQLQIHNSPASTIRINLLR